MTDLEEKLTRVLATAADQVPRQAPYELSEVVGARYRRRRARPTALLAAVAVLAVAGGAGAAVRALSARAVPEPAVSATGTPGPTARPEPEPAEKLPPRIERVWPRALHKIPAELPDGREYHPQLLLDDRTLLVMTGRSDGMRQFLWTYDLASGRPTRIAEIPPTRGSAIFADGVAAGGGNIVWWASYKDPGKQRVARIWTVPAGGGRPRQVTDVPLDNVMKKGHIRALELVGSDVIFSRESGGIYRVPLRGGEPRAVPGTEGQHLLRWPWVGRHTKHADLSKQVAFSELFNVETRKRRDAVVRPGESLVRCGVNLCSGTMPPEGELPRNFVRDRDGSRERALPRNVQLGDAPGLERFFKLVSPKSVVLYDMATGRSADLGMRPDKDGIPDGGPDRLITYRIGDRMYVVDLAAIK
ncbi:TolB family protein [Streptosporangium sp. CA-115845]|uniref:TolB family protein n=1 Tax=Streptosporangium sp. CA-115845 TaxID=3240071 RepID=UPI003D8E09FE